MENTNEHKWVCNWCSLAFGTINTRKPYGSKSHHPDYISVENIDGDPGRNGAWPKDCVIPLKPSFFLLYLAALEKSK